MKYEEWRKYMRISNREPQVGDRVRRIKGTAFRSDVMQKGSEGEIVHVWKARFKVSFHGDYSPRDEEGAGDTVIDVLHDDGYLERWTYMSLFEIIPEWDNG